MINLSTIDGKAVFLAAAAIAEVQEAGTSSQWHGIRSYVRTFDGRTIEVREIAQDIARAIRRAEMM